MQRSTLSLLLVLLGACGNDSAVPPGSVPDAPTGEPVYYGQVERIINDNCVECHSASEARLAPFSLATFEDVKAAADAQLPIAYDLMNRVMPPYYADQDGACNTFPGAKWLSPEDLDTVVTWVNGSRAEGDPANAITTEPPTLPKLDHEDRTIDTGMSYTPVPSDGSNDFRCFVVEGVDTNTFVTGIHVRPSNLTIAHHVILFTLDSPQAEADAVMQQQAAGGPYRCDGGPKNATFLAGWAPGGQATIFPANTGISVVGQRKMVVQMHYNVEHSDGLPDRTKIALQLEATVAKPAQMLPISAPIDLPVGNADAVATGTTKLPASLGTVTLWGSAIHMHQRGIGAKLSVDGSNQCLIDLVNWSFHWQHFYWAAEPVELHGGDTVRLSCHYDTTGETQRVKFCEGTECEMCIQFGYVTRN